MRTRLRSSKCAAAALGCALAVTAVAGSARAQSRSPADDEAALRREYDVAHWAQPGASHPGLALASFAVPGLQVRARQDHAPDAGGITLSLGPGGAIVTARVGVVVARDAAHAREALLRHLIGLQTRLVHLTDRHGGDIALGDNARGVEAAAVVWGNVLVWVERTPDAGAETPEAARVVELLRAHLAPAGAAQAPVPLTLVRGTSARPTNTSVHLDVRGGAFEHLEAYVTGGHLRAQPTPAAGLDVVRDGARPVTVDVTATDALGRVATATLTL